MRNETCTNCGRNARVIVGDYLFEEMGLPVTLANVDLIQCGHCGNIDPIIPNMHDLMNLIAFAVIAHPCELTGDEVRFLRKYLGMRGKELSAQLGIDPTTLSKWENGGEIGPQSDRLLRLFVLSKSEELGKKVKQLLEMLSQITECPPAHRSQLKIDTETMEYQYV